MRGATAAFVVARMSERELRGLWIIQRDKHSDGTGGPKANRAGTTADFLGDIVRQRIIKQELVQKEKQNKTRQRG